MSSILVDRKGADTLLPNIMDNDIDMSLSSDFKFPDFIESIIRRAPYDRNDRNTMLPSTETYSRSPLVIQKVRGGVPDHTLMNDPKKIDDLIFDTGNNIDMYAMGSGYDSEYNSTGGGEYGDCCFDC